MRRACGGHGGWEGSDEVRWGAGVGNGCIEVG